MTDSDRMTAPSEPIGGEPSPEPAPEPFPEPFPEPVTEPVLPDPVRQRVVALVATAIGGLPEDQLPAPLRRIAKFAPNRRARLGARPIAAQLSADPAFRQRVAAAVAEAVGDLAAA